MPEASRVTVHCAHQVVQELRSEGIDAEKLVEEAGLEMRTINREDAWIPFVKHAQLLEIAARDTGDTLFGLRIAGRLDPRDLGAIGYIGLSSRTLGDALLNLSRYLRVITDESRIELSIEGDLAHVTMEPAHPSFTTRRQATENFIAGFVRAYQFFVKRELTPAEVQFAHHFEGDARTHERFFGCPVLFAQNRSQVTLERRDLAAPIETADDRLLKILVSHCEEILRKNARSKPEQVAKLERCIIALMPTGRAKIKLVATELGMSERTLVRRLAEMGTSFSEIHDQLRLELALKYLRQPELSLTEVAFLLGYANLSAFSAAFKRKTGHTPRDARAAGP